MAEEKVVIGISQGDINGVGLEVVLKTFADPRVLEMCTPVVFTSKQTIIAYQKAAKVPEVRFNSIQSLTDIKDKAFNVLNVYNDAISLTLGNQTAEGGKYALLSLEAATEALKKGEVDALVTAPINKENIQSEEFKFPGHTEYLESKCGGKSLMCLLNDNLRVAVATGHIPLEKVAETLTTEMILDKLDTLRISLMQDFGIRAPKIAILGLNPHAGDNGVIGNAEKEIIDPAIKRAKDRGYLVFGPYPADGFFGNETYSQFDAILAMYHDQGLVPFKTLSFNNGVNFTAGLPVVRTSPDHGTAYGIAGKNEASEKSFRKALYTAIDVARTRVQYKDLTSNVLKIGRSRKER